MLYRNANEEGRAAIHQSILSGSVMACEFLILNSVRIDAVDANGNSALHMAAKQGNTGQVLNSHTPKFSYEQLRIWLLCTRWRICVTDNFVCRCACC